MKWSEQMRELQSEDEHYNQLIYDVNENVLYLNNKKLIGALESHMLAPDLTVNTLLYDDVEKIMKKYPFFTDIKFLLNCILKEEEVDTGISYSKTGKITYSEFREGNWILLFMQDYIIGIQISVKDNADAGGNEPT